MRVPSNSSQVGCGRHGLTCLMRLPTGQVPCGVPVRRRSRAAFPEARAPGHGVPPRLKALMRRHRGSVNGLNYKEMANCDVSDSAAQIALDHTPGGSGWTSHHPGTALPPPRPPARQSRRTLGLGGTRPPLEIDGSRARERTRILESRGVGPDASREVLTCAPARAVRRCHRICLVRRRPPPQSSHRRIRGP